MLIRCLADLSATGSCEARLLKSTSGAKQWYRFAYAVALSFILIKQRPPSEKGTEQITARWLWIFTGAAKQPDGLPPLCFPLNVKAQPEGAALQSETLIGHLSSTGIDKWDNSQNALCCGLMVHARVRILRHRYYFEVSTPVDALICGFTLRQLLSSPYYPWTNPSWGIFK